MQGTITQTASRPKDTVLYFDFAITGTETKFTASVQFPDKATADMALALITPVLSRNVGPLNTPISFHDTPALNKLEDGWKNATDVWVQAHAKAHQHGGPKH